MVALRHRRYFSLSIASYILALCHIILHLAAVLGIYYYTEAHSIFVITYSTHDFDLFLTEHAPELWTRYFIELVVCDLEALHTSCGRVHL